MAVELAELLSAAARGTPPPADGDVTVLRPPDSRSAGVFAFTAHHVVSADVDPAWLSSALPPDDLRAPLGAPFLAALASRTGTATGSLDMVFTAGPPRSTSDLPLVEDIPDHPRVHRALRHRTGVRVWTVSGGVLIIGRGVAGRYEVAVEVDEAARGHGLGRALFAAANTLGPPDEPLWAQVAPGNTASVRSVLAAGYRPVGAEVLLVRP